MHREDFNLLNNSNIVYFDNGATTLKPNVVKEAVDKEGIFGVLGGSYSASAIGCTVSLISGLLISFFSKGKSKRL